MARESGRLTETLSYSENSRRLSMTGRLQTVVNRDTLEAATGLLVSAIEAFNDTLKPNPSSPTTSAAGVGTFTANWVTPAFGSWSSDYTGHIIFALHSSVSEVVSLFDNVDNYIAFLKGIQQRFPSQYVQLSDLPVDPFYRGTVVDGTAPTTDDLFFTDLMGADLGTSRTISGRQAGIWYWTVFRFNPFGVSAGTPIQSATVT